jgi:hypothetical protein
VAHVTAPAEAGAAYKWCGTATLNTIFLHIFNCPYQGYAELKNSLILAIQYLRPYIRILVTGWLDKFYLFNLFSLVNWFRKIVFM